MAASQVLIWRERQRSQSEVEAYFAIAASQMKGGGKAVFF